MSTTMDWQSEHHGETLVTEDHSHDLIHELSRRLNCIRRLDRYIANSGSQPEIQEFWRDSKRRELSHIDQLNRLIRTHVNFNTFS
jgi:hypothetical protein